MRFVIILLVLANIAMADTDKNIPKKLEVGANTYSLCKEHTIRYAYVIKIAYVGLYLKDCSVKQNLLKTPDKLIRFNYQVKVKAQIFIDAAEEFFLKNLKQNQITNSQEVQELKHFNQLYENIESSEYYDLYHKHGERLMLFKNDKLLGTSENADFSFKYFNIWFGDEPSVKSLKKEFSF